MEFSLQRFEAARRVVQRIEAIEPSPLFTGPLHPFETLPSTNQMAWTFAKQGAAAGTAVLALEQTAGRGQWGKQWLSSRGGLYLSVILPPDLPVEWAAQLTLITAWGVATALRRIPSRLSRTEATLPIQLKWLNDLVVGNQKLGGILTETRVQHDRITQAVVGVGINWSNAVPPGGIRLRSLISDRSLPPIESLELLAAITLHGVLTGFEQWQHQGIESILPEYFDLLNHRDRPVIVEGRSGTLIGITPTGELRVRLNPSQQEEITQSFDEEILLKPGTISLGYR